MGRGNGTGSDWDESSGEDGARNELSCKFEAPLHLIDYTCQEFSAQSM